MLPFPPNPSSQIYVSPESTATVPTSSSSFHPVHATRAPAYLRDYHCNSIPQSFSTSHPLSVVLSYDRLSTSHKSFGMALSSHVKPTTFSQAAAIPKWQEAMFAELRALEDNDTWSFVSLPLDKHPVDCKWVHKIKYHTDGSLERYKAHLVAKRFTQQESVDCFDTFSPVAKLVTIKVLLTLAAIYGWTLTQLDVNNAFLR